MKITLTECREAKKNLEDLRDSCMLNLDGQERLAKAIGLLQTIVTHLEKDVALELPETMGNKTNGGSGGSGKQI